MKPARPSYHYGQPYADLPEGWLTAEEIELLSALAKDKLVLEIGSWLGRSTVVMARVASHVVAVDHHHGSAEHGPAVFTLQHFLDNLESRGVRERVSICVMDSVHLDLFHSDSFDLVFIDGGHDFGTASRDLNHAFRLVRTEGVIAVHDYRPSVTSKGGVVSSSWPQVVAAVNDLAPRSGWRIEQLVGDLAVLRK